MKLENVGTNLQKWVVRGLDRLKHSIQSIEASYWITVDPDLEV